MFFFRPNIFYSERHVKTDEIKKISAIIGNTIDILDFVFVDDLLVYICNNFLICRKKNGKILWVKKLQKGFLQCKFGCCGYKINCSNGIVYLSSINGVLEAVKLQNGKRKFFIKFPAPINSNPLIDQHGIVVLCANNTVYALDTEGKMLWNHEGEERIEQICKSPSLQSKIYYNNGIKRVI